MNTETTAPARTKPDRMDAQEVIDAVSTQLPELIEHIAADAAWLWYVGPSLQGQPATRQVLKDIGFRFAPKGHAMPNGKGIGSWGHSCLKPTPRRRTAKAQPQRVSDRPEPDPVASLANLFSSFD